MLVIDGVKINQIGYMDETDEQIWVHDWRLEWPDIFSAYDVAIIRRLENTLPCGHNVQLLDK